MYNPPMMQPQQLNGGEAAPMLLMPPPPAASSSTNDVAASADTNPPLTKRRKRKSRWAPTSDDSNDVDEEKSKASSSSPKKDDEESKAPVEEEKKEEPAPPKKRRNRWGKAAPALVPKTQMTPEDHAQFQQRMNILNEINRKLCDPDGPKPDADDPFLLLPSPEPVYDSTGKRVNTQQQRYKAKLSKDRMRLIHQCIQLNPAYKPPADYSPPKHEAILMIPQSKYPDYNFIGAILGPRGNSQKRLEKETACKVSIRGAGSAKEGRRRAKGFTSEGDDLPLHVHISAPSEKHLKACKEKVKKLLVPLSEEKKAQQMRELALINGTLRLDNRCTTCGEMGHKKYECPNRDSTYFAGVRCSICQEMSHPTRDCPRKGMVQSQDDMDKEYQDFMAELTGEKASKTSMGPVKTIEAAPIVMGAPPPQRSHATFNRIGGAQQPVMISGHGGGVGVPLPAVGGKYTAVPPPGALTQRVNTNAAPPPWRSAAPRAPNLQPAVNMVRHSNTHQAIPVHVKPYQPPPPNAPFPQFLKHQPPPPQNPPAPKTAPSGHPMQQVRPAYQPRQSTYPPFPVAAHGYWRQAPPPMMGYRPFPFPNTPGRWVKKG